MEVIAQKQKIKNFKKLRLIISSAVNANSPYWKNEVEEKEKKIKINVGYY